MPSCRSAAALVALLLPLAALSGACSQQDDPTADELQEDLAEELREQDGELSADEADCYAGLLVAEIEDREELGLEAVNDVDFSDEEPSADLADAIAAAAADARAECGLSNAPG